MSEIFQIKVKIKYSEPPIWRRILISDEINFLDLHEILQGAFNWENCHLYQFDIDKKIGIGPPPNPAFDYSFPDTLDASAVLVKTYLKKEKQKIEYTYDFGDSWEHEITLEKILPIAADQKYPLCIKGALNGPLEDSGGMWGHSSRMKVLKNPKHKDYDEVKEWMDAGGDDDEYDPNHFSLEEINDRIQSK